MIEPQDFMFVSRFLKQKAGLVLSDGKQYLLEGRLLPLSRKCGFASVTELVDFLRKTENTPTHTMVIEAMVTNETLFFRDRHPFESFAAVMLPTLLRARPPSAPLRVWCAAASTGQEPYSLAMLLRDYPDLLSGRPIEILATDISTEVLARAREGRYSDFEIQRGLPPHLLQRYFAREGDWWQLSEDVRRMVTFRRLNLLESFHHVGIVDIVFCRNVLIYFDAATKIDILERIALQMTSDGYLVLGGPETILNLTEAFEPATACHGAYRPNNGRAAAA